MTPAPMEQLLADVLQRASTDGEFRTRLLTSPDDALREEFGVTLPAGVRIKFVEKDPEFDAVYVLPELQAADGQLTDDDLDAVAGGFEAYRWDGNQ